MSKLEAALEAARRGFRVFPLIPNEKKPQIENWQNLATTNEESIRKCWAEDPDRNIGIVTQRHIVIDIDPRNGGDVSFEALTLYREFPKTLRTKTAGGGDHIIYALPDHVFVRCSKNKIGAGIDIKSYGGLIVAPGSTINDVAYEWGNDRAPALAPQWLLDECRAPAPRSPLAGRRLVKEDAIAIEMAIAWVSKHAPQAVLGELKDTAYRVACQFYNFGLEIETASELMREWGDACCSPRLEDETIAHVLQSAPKYMNQPAGVLHPKAAQLESVEISPRKEADKKSEQAPDAIFLKADFAVDKALTNGARPLIKGLYDRNTLILVVGPPGEGKSFLVLDHAYHIIKAAPWSGMRAHKGAVVYVAAEGGEGIFARLAALRLHYKTDLEGLYVLPRSIDLLHTPAEAEKILAGIKGIEKESGCKVELVIVDTVARALAGGDENSSQDMGALVKNLDRIRLGAGCATLGVHHTGKDKARGARGHSSLLGAVDTEIQVSGGRVTSTKQRDMDKAVKINFKLKKIRIGMDSEGDEVTSCYVELGAPDEAHEIPLTGKQEEIRKLVAKLFPKRKFTLTELLSEGPSSLPSRYAVSLLLHALWHSSHLVHDEQEPEYWQYVSGKD